MKKLCDVTSFTVLSTCLYHNKIKKKPVPSCVTRIAAKQRANDGKQLKFTTTKMSKKNSLRKNFKKN